VILLPLLAVVAWALAFWSRGRDFLEATLASLVVFGVTVTAATELQSLTGTLTTTGSAITWALAAGLGGGGGRRGVGGGGGVVGVVGAGRRGEGVRGGRCLAGSG
jgi:hypothetical protein